MSYRKSALGWLDENSHEMFEMSDLLFKWAEPGLREYKSGKHLADYMSRQGFTVERGVSDMPTAFNSSCHRARLNKIEAPCSVIAASA